MENLRQDVRYAVRALARMRGTAILAVVTLGAGIAATTTMISVVYATLFRPPPFDHPESLVVVSLIRQTPRAGTVRLRWPYSKIVALRQAARSFESLGAFTSSATVSVAEPSGALQVFAEVASAAYLRALRPEVVSGRIFEDAEDEPGHPVALVREGFWRRQYPGEPFAPGRTLVVNGEALTVVGMLPDRFRGVGGRADLWLPVGMAPALTYRDFLTTPQHFISVIGRLKPGVSLAQANAELAVVGSSLPNGASSGVEPATWSAAALPLGEARIDAAQAQSAWLLLAAVACVLIVTCVNVAMLLLIRARLRRREIAVRLALGAARGRVVRQLLTETAILVSAGGMLGLLLTSWGIALVRWASADPLAATHTGYVQIAAFSTPRFDATAFLWTTILTVICTAAAGLAPAARMSGGSSSAALWESGRSTTGAHRRSLGLLAGVEIALAVLLLSGALLLVATFSRLQQSDASFDPSQVLTFWIEPPSPRYPPESGPAILQRVLERVRQVPGVRSAALNRCTPFGSSCARTTLFRADQPTPAAAAPVVGRHYVSPDYFRTLGIPLIRGRQLATDDRLGRPPVTIVNESAARRFWPSEDPIGKRVWFGSSTGFTDPNRPVEVVGVVGDVKYWPLDEPPGPDFYTSYQQFAYPDSVFMIRADGDPRGLVPSLRAAIAEVDPAIPLWDVRLLEAAMSDALSRPRFNAALTSGFALTAVLLAGLGIFGVMSSGIAARGRELAIRLALGASPAGLRRLVFSQSLRLAVSGSAAGLVGAAVLLRLLGGMLFGIMPGSPLVLGTAVLTMIGVALAAAIVPAARAAATDPVAALKQE